MLKTHPGIENPDSLTTPAGQSKTETAERRENDSKPTLHRYDVPFGSVKTAFQHCKTVVSIPKPEGFRAVKEVQNFQASNSWGSSRILSFPCLGLFFDLWTRHSQLVWYPCPLFDKHICLILKKSSLLENILQFIPPFTISFVHPISDFLNPASLYHLNIT